MRVKGPRCAPDARASAVDTQLHQRGRARLPAPHNRRQRWPTHEEPPILFASSLARIRPARPGAALALAPAGLAALACGLLALVWMVLLHDLGAHLRSATADARQHVETLAGVASHAVQSASRAADLLLVDLRHEWTQDRAGFGQAVARRRQRAPIRADFEVTVLDAAGSVVVSTLAMNPPGTDLSGLAAFRHLHEGGVDELWASRHGQGAQAEGSHLDFARPLFSRDGEFAGVVICAIGSDYLVGQLNGFDLGPGGAMTLVSSDGETVMQLARAPRSAATALARQTHVVREALPEPLRLATDGFAVIPSPVDRASERLVAWRTPVDYPLTLVLGQPADSLNDALAQLRWRYFGVGATLSVAIAAGLYWLMRHRALRDRIGRERARHDIELTKAHAALTASERELRQLSTHQLVAKEAERKRIAQEIHDELGQRLTVHRIEVAMLGEAVKRDPGALLPSRIQGMKDDIDGMLSVARDIAHKLRPGALDIGLAPAAESLLHEFTVKLGIPCELTNRLPPGLKLDDIRATGAFRIMQEAITNAARHARPQRVRVALSLGDGSLVLRIHDDGAGFDTEAPGPTSFGLSGMRERATALGGSLEIVSSPGLGTSVEMRMPLPAGAEPRGEMPMNCLERGAIP
jgi:signal transduction histidine kinase